MINCKCHCHNNHNGMSPANPMAQAFCKCLPNCEHCQPASKAITEKCDCYCHYPLKSITEKCKTQPCDCGIGDWCSTHGCHDEDCPTEKKADPDAIGADASEEWLERFNKNFTMGHPDLFWLPGSAAKPKNVKAFIAEEINRARAEGEQRMQGVVDAWMIAGSQPAYHEEIKQRLKRMWPRLYYAIQALATSDQPEKAGE